MSLISLLASLLFCLRTGNRKSNSLPGATGSNSLALMMSFCTVWALALNHPDSHGVVEQGVVSKSFHVKMGLLYSVDQCDE